MPWRSNWFVRNRSDDYAGGGAGTAACGKGCHLGHTHRVAFVADPVG